jgi:hypothetical protein
MRSILFQLRRQESLRNRSLTSPLAPSGLRLQCPRRACGPPREGLRAAPQARLGPRLEAGYGARARDIAAQLALHFEHGGEVARAVPYLQQVADTASRRNAHHERA